MRPEKVSESETQTIPMFGSDGCGFLGPLNSCRAFGTYSTRVHSHGRTFQKVSAISQKQVHRRFTTISLVIHHLQRDSIWAAVRWELVAQKHTKASELYLRLKELESTKLSLTVKTAIEVQK